jgi:hypothetical protein
MTAIAFAGDGGFVCHGKSLGHNEEHEASNELSKGRSR